MLKFEGEYIFNAPARGNLYDKSGRFLYKYEVDFLKRFKL